VVAAVRAEEAVLLRARDSARRAGRRAEAAYRAGLADVSATLDAALSVPEIDVARLEAVAAVLTAAAAGQAGVSSSPPGPLRAHRA
jgi:outer membrane protein TolC